MAELLIKAIDAIHSDPLKDRRGCYKRGMVVVVMPDGHPWGAEERLPKFVVVKIPGVTPERVKKYMLPFDDPLALRDAPPLQRRRWRLRWADLPQRAKNILANSGQLIIAAGSYTGPSDYTWEQIKAYWRNDEMGVNEVESL